ncbi:hypothetical protein ACJX0J_022416, partial [Zea mays]
WAGVIGHDDHIWGSEASENLAMELVRQDVVDEGHKSLCLFHICGCLFHVLTWHAGILTLENMHTK